MNGKQKWPGHEVFSKGIFAALPESEWKARLGTDPPATIDRKSLVFREGDPATHVYLIGGGLVKSFKCPSRERVQIVNILGPGDVLGAEALTRESYGTSAATLARTVLFRSSKAEFLDFASRRPSVSVALIELLNRENADLQSLLCEVGTKKALPRVASCILLFMEKQVEPGATRAFNLPISRQEMGAYLGLSPETVSRQLKDLSDSRVIRLEHRRMTVLDPAHLRSIAEV